MMLPAERDRRRDELGLSENDQDAKTKPRRVARLWGTASGSSSVVGTLSDASGRTRSEPSRSVARARDEEYAELVRESNFRDAHGNDHTDLGPKSADKREDDEAIEAELEEPAITLESEGADGVNPVNRITPSANLETPQGPPPQERALSLLALVMPRDLYDEQVGDALEVIDRLRTTGAAPWMVWLKVASTFFWCLVNAAGEVVHKLTGKKKTQ